jgi:hypothetical protein
MPRADRKEAVNEMPDRCMPVITSDAGGRVDMKLSFKFEIEKISVWRDDQGLFWRGF